MQNDMVSRLNNVPSQLFDFMGRGGPGYLGCVSFSDGQALATYMIPYSFRTKQFLALVWWHDCTAYGYHADCVSYISASTIVHALLVGK